MQGIIELPMSEGYFLITVSLLALALMVIATMFIFMTKGRGAIASVDFDKYTLGSKPDRFQRISSVSKAPMMIAIIMFGAMLAGIALLVGYDYTTTAPVFKDYFFNLFGVAAIAGAIAVIVAYGIATMGLYADSLKR